MGGGRNPDFSHHTRGKASTLGKRPGVNGPHVGRRKVL